MATPTVVRCTVSRLRLSCRISALRLKNELAILDYSFGALLLSAYSYVVWTACLVRQSATSSRTYCAIAQYRLSVPAAAYCAYYTAAALFSVCIRNCASTAVRTSRARSHSGGSEYCCGFQPKPTAGGSTPAQAVMQTKPIEAAAKKALTRSFPRLCSQIAIRFSTAVTNIVALTDSCLRTVCRRLITRSPN